MAKYECKVCGYIYNEQHAGRTFDELTECPICNESKANFVALDADNNPIVEEKAEDKAEKELSTEAEAAAEEVKEDAFGATEEVKEDVFVTAEEREDAETKTEEQGSSFAMYKEIKSEPQIANASDSDFVVERRQDFWTPVSANAEKKPETSNNTTGWTISNAMGSVEKVIGGEEEIKEEVKEDIVTAVEEDEDMPAFNSRIESFYASADPVRASHIISGDEEEDNFKPLWNAGGGTVQRVIDPFNDKNDSVVKAENIGMVMPAEEPVVEEILGEEDLTEDVEEMDFVAEEEEINPFRKEEEVAEETEESDLEDDILFPADEEEVLLEDNKEEDLTAVDFLDEEDDDFFTEMTMDAVVDVAEDAHEHGDSNISEEDVFRAIDAIEFDEDVPEGGRIEIVTGDDKAEDDFETIFEESEAEEIVEDAAEVVEASDEDDFAFEDAKEDDLVFEEVKDEYDDMTFEDKEDEDSFVFEDVKDEDDFTFEDVKEDDFAFEDAVEETAEAVAEETEEVTADEEEPFSFEDAEDADADAQEDDEPFFFEEIDDIPAEATEDDFEIEETVEDGAEVVEEITEDSAEETVTEEAAEVMDDIADEVTEETEAVAEENVEEVLEESTEAEETPRVKAWSFLDDVVGAGVATGVGIAGVDFVTKSMDEVVEEEVTEEDIEEVFVDFAQEPKADEAEHTIKTNLAEELFAIEESIPEESVVTPVAKEEKEPAYCNNLEKILIVPAQLNPMPLPEGTAVEGRTVLGIASERPLVLDNPVFSTGDYNMVQYIPNSGLTSEDYQKADAIEVIVGHGNGIEKTINSKEDLRQVVNFLRLESDGCPIGIKMGAARIERDLEFCVFAKPDYVVLNNFDVVPLPYALHRATKFLNTVQSDMDIVIALDGAKDAEELAKIMAMGADVIALRNRPEKMDEMVEGLKGYARITGHYDVEDLNVKDLCTIDREIAEFTDIYHV